jgi:hypothetical protein
VVLICLSKIQLIAHVIGKTLAKKLEIYPVMNIGTGISISFFKLKRTGTHFFLLNKSLVKMNNSSMTVETMLLRVFGI